MSDDYTPDLVAGYMGAEDEDIEPFEVWLRRTCNEIIESDELVQMHLSEWVTLGPGITLVIDTGDGVPGSEDDLTCDYCGKVAEGLGLASIGFRIAGPGNLDYVELPTQEAIPLIVTLGLCQECLDSSGAMAYSTPLGVP